MLQQEAVASAVPDVRPQSTADQDGTDDGLKETGSGSLNVYSYEKSSSHPFLLIALRQL